jgi:hypothetical protein
MYHPRFVFWSGVEVCSYSISFGSPRDFSVYLRRLNPRLPMADLRASVDELAVRPAIFPFTSVGLIRACRWQTCGPPSVNSRFTPRFFRFTERFLWIWPKMLILGLTERNYWFSNEKII